MANKTDQPEFWEAAFHEKNEIWGFEPSRSALLAKDLFVQQAAKNILIPGIGYGRSGQVFLENGMTVTGIETSGTAIELAEKHYGAGMVIHHGSVTDMPFDDKKYDGIFCYALIHLLDESERAKLIRDCYDQLAENGNMVFTVISKAAHTYGQGKFISKDRYEMFGGVKMSFYDLASIHQEFDNAGLVEITAITENYPFLFSCLSALNMSLIDLLFFNQNKITNLQK